MSLAKRIKVLQQKANGLLCEAAVDLVIDIANYGLMVDGDPGPLALSNLVEDGHAAEVCPISRNEDLRREQRPPEKCYVLQKELCGLITAEKEQIEMAAPLGRLCTLDQGRSPHLGAYASSDNE